MLTSSQWPGVLTLASKQCTYVFVLMINHTWLSMFCLWFVTLWKSSFPRTPLTRRKLLPLNPPYPLEFPMIFHGGAGGGMDIFWNHTIQQLGSCTWKQDWLMAYCPCSLAFRQIYYWSTLFPITIPRYILHASCKFGQCQLVMKNYPGVWPNQKQRNILNE